MATVPYQPVPTVTPEAAPTRRLQINTNGAMFGENIGTALDSLGHDVSSVGNQLYQTATNFRKLEIENQVNQAVTGNDLESGELINGFKLLEGNDPQAQFKTHVGQLQSTRESHRNSIDSEYGRQEYDRQTMRKFAYDVTNAGSHAATQAKQFNKQVRNTGLMNAIDQLAKDPHNEQFMNDQLAKIADFATSDSMDAGETQQVREGTVKDKLGMAIDKVAKTIKDPDQAIAFVNRAKDYMRSTKFLDIMAQVEDRAVVTRAARDGKMIADPLQSFLDKARPVTAQQESSGDYGNVTTTTNPRTGQTQRALGAFGVMDFNLKEWTKKAIGREVSEQEFLANKDIQNKVYDTYMGDYFRRFGARGAALAWIGGEGAVKGDENIKDALGTPRGRYADDFVSKVGNYDPRSSTAQSLVDMDKAVEAKAAQLYANDPVRRDQYIRLGQQAVRQNTRIQQQEIDQQEKALKLDVNTALNTQDQKTGFYPRSIEEASKIDPKFEQKLNDLKTYDPGYRERVEKTFKANAIAETPWSIEKQNNAYKLDGTSVEDLEKMDREGKLDEMYSNGQIMRADLLRNKTRLAKAHLKSQSEMNVDGMLGRNLALLDQIQAYPKKVQEGDDEAPENQRYRWLRGRAIAAMDAHIQKTGVPMDKREQEELMKDLTREIVTKRHDTWFFGTVSRPDYFVTEDKEYEFERQQREVDAAKATQPKEVKPVSVRRGPDGKTYWMGSDGKVREGDAPEQGAR